MRFLTGLFSRAWWPVMTDTTSPSYWLNWRFLVCAIWVLVAMVFAALLVWRYEGRNRISRNRSDDDQHEAMGCLYEDEVWATCLKFVHPVWLLGYRLIAFGALLALLIADITNNGAVKYFFYTEWTFTLVAVYFGLASSLSIRGCMHYCQEGKLERDCRSCTDANNGSYVPPSLTENVEPIQEEGSSNCGDPNCTNTASVWGYTLQIIFQICAGAVALTDSVFWLLIYPYMTAYDYRLNFLIVSKHSVNAVFLLGDAILNRLRFPFFRIAYFVLWTCIYVVFQWIIHACISIRWPYPFLDLSSLYAPLWYVLICFILCNFIYVCLTKFCRYFAVGLLLFPCFGIFSLIFRLKQCFLSRSR
ncbi:hypothetical protein PHJA_000946000 [Phtheirospermum japonicum]|uniref:Transmembrane protein n=1 Tax=Phtheirospermum japonicum TaxID=374723 RepID=A0A830BVT5_9LAMI|nr:hypothetical protein PHJA_000946000 [Phtheirospermum japonicum]